MLMAGGGAFGLAAAAGVGYEARGATGEREEAGASERTVPFDGVHQAGIATPAQGTYVVARRIRMRIETWDHAPLSEQESTIGRHKATGAPLGRRDEFDPPKFGSLPVDAHIRLAQPGENDNQAILRRGYAYTDGIDPRTGLLDAGLFFVCFQRDPHRQFAAIQRRLGQNDKLNEYIEHTASGLFAIPPGARPGEHIGQALFA